MATRAALFGVQISIAGCSSQVLDCRSMTPS
jgi:hypothetical protein